MASLMASDEWYHGTIEEVVQIDTVLLHVMGSNDRSDGITHDR